MKFTLVLQAFALLYLGVTDGFNGFNVRYTEEQRDENNPVPHGGNMTCFCDGLKKTEVLPEDHVMDIFQSIRQHNFCGQNYSAGVCDLLTTCQNCSAEMQKCLPVANSTKYFCFQKGIVVQQYLRKSKDNDSTEVEDRVARQTATCAYPKTLTTADLYCKKYPSKIKCIQKCIFGHTLKEGITREIQCIHEENVWKPVGFEECEPFVDCTMILVSPGKLSCVTPTTKSAPACNVTCDRYEDKFSTPERSFVCRISGMWNMKLPYCAVAGSGLDLVPAPRIKLHLKV